MSAASTAPTSPQIRRLQDVINSFSITSKSQPLLPPSRVVELLSDPAVSRFTSTSAEETLEDHENEYLWLVAAKAAIQASGLTMNLLLDHTMEIHRETEYWSDVLGSVWYSGFYAAQTSPSRLWHWSTNAFEATAAHGTDLSSRSISARWAQFYELARHSLRELSDSPLRLTVSAPVRSCRAEIRQKRNSLLATKDIHTASLGLLMDKWLKFQTDGFVASQDTENNSKAQWQDAISETVLLTETILKQADKQSSSSQFETLVEKTVASGLTHVQAQSSPDVRTPQDLIQRILLVVRDHLPNHSSSTLQQVSRHGRPSRLTRAWIPVLAAIMSGSISLRVLSRHQDELIQWIMGLGSTIIDFGVNWVVEPIRKLVGTIRHDEGSEIAIMSKNSLVADRASLERMVIDFVRDRPDQTQGQTAVEDTSAIANAVREGDLTPVLKAYERDLRSPFTGTIRGDLVRALLIQIQKTKVDVEVAISGINSLLKSQELVFGLVLNTI